MKNVLVIPPFNPYPLRSGGHQAIFNGIAILQNVANVFLLVDTTERRLKRGQGREIEVALPFVKVLPFIEYTPLHFLRLFCRILLNKVKCGTKSDPSSSHIPHMNKFPLKKQKCILEIIKKYQIDIVQVEMASMIRAVEFLPESVKRIFVCHEVRFVRLGLQLETCFDTTENDWRRWTIEKKEEVTLLNCYDDIITLSAIDTGKLQRAGVQTLITSSFSVVRNSDKSNTSNVPIKKVLSFVGPQKHFPNYDGVMWFLENCWRKLIVRESSYQFQIVGEWKNCTKAKVEKEYKGVRFRGFVENLYETIVGTTMIVPLNIGSGIRMKILEAAQMGVPIVSTPVGAEGLPLKDGENAFIAADADEFVEDIIRLQSAALRKKFVDNAMTEIAKKYTLEALSANRVELYR